MYRFQIYQNINIPPIYTDKINKSRYSLRDYNLEREINPVWNNLSFLWEKDKDRGFFRKKLKGEFSLVDQDYEWALSVRSGEFEINRYRYLKISEKIDGLWEEVWKGFFAVSDGEFDFSKCTVVFTDLLVFDKYTSIIENIDNEVNLIDLPAVAPVSYLANLYPYESIIETEELSVTDFCNDVYWGVGTYFKDTKYTLYSKKYRLKTGRAYILGGNCVYSAQFTVIKEWRRDYQYAGVNPGGSWADTGEEDENGNHKYVRHYRGDESPGYSTKKTRVEYQTLPSYEEFTETCDYCNLYNITISFSGAANDDIENERGRTLSDAIIYAIKDYVDFFDNEGNLLPAYQSQFFRSEANPVTGEDNAYNIIALFQISDMKPTSNAATLAMYSIETLEEFFSLFQCRWYIDDNGYFVVEHDKFFDNGLSYVGNSVGLDISDRNIPITIKYLDDIPYKETMSLSYSVEMDFVGRDIECHGNIVNRREDASTKEHSFQNFATDLNHVVSNPADIGNDGFFAMAITVDNETGEAEVISSEGILSGVIKQNCDMSISTIQDRFWKWGRSLGYGIMNGEMTDFEQKRIIVHDGIVVSDCSQFNPYKLVKTSFGEGEVVKAEHSLADKKLTLELRY